MYLAYLEKIEYGKNGSKWGRIENWLRLFSLFGKNRKLENWGKTELPDMEKGKIIKDYEKRKKKHF